MQTPFDKKTGQWQIEWPGRVSRHDLVYLSPPDDPMTGLILGNGEVGVLCYVEDTKVILIINYHLQTDRVKSQANGYVLFVIFSGFFVPYSVRSVLWIYCHFRCHIPVFISG